MTVREMVRDLSGADEELRRLEQGEIHLWVARAVGGSPQDEWLSLEPALSPNERAQLERRLRAADRHLFLVAHALLRVVSGHYLRCDPGEVPLCAGEHGKPILDGAAAQGELQLSLTHSGGVVACAIAAAGPVGVDVEAIDRRADVTAIAERFFVTSESARLSRISPARRARRFFLYWTLKEAILKAVGTGLTVPLSTTSVDLGRRDSWKVALAGPLANLDSGWWLAALGCGDRHLTAVAVHTRRDVTALRCRQVLTSSGCTPLRVRCVGMGSTEGAAHARLVSDAVGLEDLRHERQPGVGGPDRS